MDYWTCEGSVRGDCGTRHRTEQAAIEHCLRDHRAVQRGHGESSYSDRRPRRYASTRDDELTVEGVAAHLGLSVRTVQDYRLDGRLPPPVATYGRTPVWTRQQLDEWQASRPGSGRWGPRNAETPRQP